jgi:hypothetical protein
MGWWDSFRQTAGQLADQGLAAAGGLAGKVAEFFRTRSKPVLICFIACVILLIFGITAILVSVQANARNTGTGDVRDLSEVFSPRSVPPEEFFLPDEPDYLPETLPEREKRKSWTVEDAAPFWTDPLDEGAGAYPDLMSTAIDDLMERVP